MPSYPLYVPLPLQMGTLGASGTRDPTEVHSARPEPSLWTLRRNPFPSKCGIMPHHKAKSVNEHKQASIGNN